MATVKESGKKKDRKPEGTVRVAYVEAICTKEQRKRIQDAQLVVRRGMNVMWQEWLAWHTINKSRRAMRESIATLRKWHQSCESLLPPEPPMNSKVAVRAEWKRQCTRIKDEYAKANPKPYDDIQCFPEDLNLYRIVTDECPELATATTATITHIFQQTFPKLKAKNGSMPAWRSILAGDQNMASFTKKGGCGIPVRKTNCLLFKRDGKFFVRVKFAQLLSSDSAKGLVDDEYQVFYKNVRRFDRMKRVLNEIVTGKRPLASMTVSINDGKVFVSIAYRLTYAPKAAAGAGICILRPCKHSPWRVRFLDVTRERTNSLDESLARDSEFINSSAIGFRGGDGGYVANHRRRIFMQKWARRVGNRYSGQASRGRGDKRANLAIERLSRNWNDFMETCNQRTAREVVQDCIRRGASTIVYFQPKNGSGKNRFLETAGKSEEYETSSGWAWHLMKVALERACQKSKGRVSVVVADRASDLELSKLPPSLATFIQQRVATKKKRPPR